MLGCLLNTIAPFGERKLRHTDSRCYLAAPDTADESIFCLIFRLSADGAVDEDVVTVLHGQASWLPCLALAWVGSPCVIVSQPGLQRLPVGHAQWQSFCETQVRLLDWRAGGAEHGESEPFMQCWFATIRKGRPCRNDDPCTRQRLLLFAPVSLSSVPTWDEDDGDHDANDGIK